MTASTNIPVFAGIQIDYVAHPPRSYERDSWSSSAVITGDFHKLEIESNHPMIIHIDGEILPGSTPISSGFPAR
jgi:diacylglycerol kinase family enzyme